MYNEVRDILFKATKAAGAVIEQYFQGAFKIENKSTVNDLVTEVDKHAEKVIIDIIKLYYPTHSVISEEAGELMQNSDYEWIIDPIDGTVNFAHGIPICCVSIGVRHKGQMVLGAVFNPIMKELFFAERGKGAYLNDVKISVSKKADFKTACLVTGFPYKWPKSYVHPIKVFERFIMEGLPVRRLGSAAIDLCWVACGRFDGFWEYNLNPWDIAAGYLIVEEAGGKITNFDGDAYNVNDKETLATNGLIHNDMLNLIRSNI